MGPEQDDHTQAQLARDRSKGTGVVRELRAGLLSIRVGHTVTFVVATASLAQISSANRISMQQAQLRHVDHILRPAGLLFKAQQSLKPENPQLHSRRYFLDHSFAYSIYRELAGRSRGH